MGSAQTLKQDAQLKYRWFDLPPALREGKYQEFNDLCDSHRWHEAEIMLKKLEKVAKTPGAANG